MTPLFAPKPAPRGVAFGPGYGEQMQWRHGWGQQGAGHPAPAPQFAPSPLWPTPGSPAYQGHYATRGAWPTDQPAPFGGGFPPSPYGTLPQQTFVPGFGGFDPFAQQQIMRSGFAPNWGGPTVR